MEFQVNVSYNVQRRKPQKLLLKRQKVSKAVTTISANSQLNITK